MATVRVEFINVTQNDPPISNGPDNVISRRVGSAVELTASATATVAASRPVVPPTANGVRLTALDGDAFATWGVDPTATVANGFLLLTGRPEVLDAKVGDLYSFITRT